MRQWCLPGLGSSAEIDNQLSFLGLPKLGR